MNWIDSLEEVFLLIGIIQVAEVVLLYNLLVLEALLVIKFDVLTPLNLEKGISSNLVLTSLLLRHFKYFFLNELLISLHHEQETILLIFGR